MDLVLNNIDALWSVLSLFNSFFEDRKIDKTILIKPIMESVKGFGGLKKLTIEIHVNSNGKSAKVQTIVVKGSDEKRIYESACKKLAQEFILICAAYGT